MWEKQQHKKKKIRPMLFLVWGMVIFVACGIAWGVYNLLASGKNGSGNVLNYSYVTEFKDDIYFVNPGDERLIRLRDAKTEAVTETGVRYLTCMEDSLYYVSNDTSFLMRYNEGAEDEIILDYGCNNPIYQDDMLYFYSGKESCVYTVSVEEGKFGDPVLLNENIQVISFSLDDTNLYYISATDMGLWRWPLDGSAMPKKLSNEICSNPMVSDGEVYFQVIGDNASGIRVIRKNGKEETLVDASIGCMNISGKWVYYTDVSKEAEGRVYKIQKNGKGNPEKVTDELGMELTIVSDYLYYRTYNLQDGLVWKRLSVKEFGKNKKAAEVLGVK